MLWLVKTYKGVKKMGLKDSFMHFFNLDEDVEEQMEKVEQNEEQRHSAARLPSRRSRLSQREQEMFADQEQEENSVEIVQVSPDNFEDVQMIIDEGAQRKIVVFSLNKVTRVEAKRMLDFISGAVYVLDAQIVKVRSQTFIFALGTLDIEPVLSEYRFDETVEMR